MQNHNLDYKKFSSYKGGSENDYFIVDVKRHA